jgi:hypothetical protein
VSKELLLRLLTNESRKASRPDQASSAELREVLMLAAPSAAMVLVASDGDELLVAGSPRSRGDGALRRPAL